MNAYTKALIAEIAPVIERLVDDRVAHEVARVLRARVRTAAAPRSPWLANVAYGEGARVEYRGAVYLATTATCETPSPEARTWRVQAEAS